MRRPGTVCVVSETPAGWYPDPTNPLQERLWDGSDWVDRVRPRQGKPASTETTTAPTPRRRSSAGAKVLLVFIALVFVVNIPAIFGLNTSPQEPDPSVQVSAQPSVAAQERERACPIARTAIMQMNQWHDANPLLVSEQSYLSMASRVRDASVQLSGILKDDGRSEKVEGISSEFEQMLEDEFERQYGQGAPLLNSNLAIARNLKTTVDTMEHASSNLSFEDLSGVTSKIEFLRMWSGKQGAVVATAEQLAAMCGWAIVRPNPGDYGYEQQSWRLENLSR
jgi:hypothetical protein